MFFKNIRYDHLYFLSTPFMGYLSCHQCNYATKQKILKTGNRPKTKKIWKHKAKKIVKI